MFRKPKTAFRRVRARRKARTALLLSIGFLLVNALAFVHAYAMTHFVAGGSRTAPPESLTLPQKAAVLLTGVRVPRPTNFATPGDFGLPFETRRFASTDGIDLEAWSIPAAPPAAPPVASKGAIVCFHGYTACKSSLLVEARALHAMGYDVMLVDFRGSGGSSSEQTTIGFREADDVAAAVADARARFPHAPLFLYGQSMGSAAILRAVAFNGVAPDALVLECPFDRLLSTAENRFDLMGVPSLVAGPAARLLVFWGGVQQGYWAFAHNPGEYARRVRCPTLLLHGGLDSRVTRRQAESVYGRLGGAKQLIVFEEVAHQAYAVQEPKKWQAAVGTFLARWNSGDAPLRSSP